jgi:hypothetical protein
MSVSPTFLNWDVDNDRPSVSRQELVPWLQQQITEQKRVDATTSGVSLASDPSQAISQSKELPTSSDVQLILPGDAKKQRKQTKQIFLDRGKLRCSSHSPTSQSIQLSRPPPSSRLPYMLVFKSWRWTCLPQSSMSSSRVPTG